MWKRNSLTLVVFVDILISCMMLLILSINPVPTEDANAKPVADYTFYMSWDTGSPVDMDMMMSTPMGPTWFAQKETKDATLERDDLGNNTSQLNLEIMSLREPTDGDYVLSVRNYSQYEPVAGEIIVSVADHNGKTIFERKFPMPLGKQEHGVCEFSVKDGKIVLLVPSEAGVVALGLVK